MIATTGTPNLPPNGGGPFHENNFIFTLIAIAVVILAIYIGNCRSKVATATSQTNFINALSDSIKTLKLDSSIKSTKIASLQMETSKQFIDLKINSADITKLQAIVKSYNNKLKAGSSITNTTVTTHINKTTPNLASDSSNVMFYVDTSSYSGNNLIMHGTNNALGIASLSNPYFESKYNDKWINYDIRTYQDSTHSEININNEYSVILGYDKKVPFADVINYNPYSTITKLRTFQVSVPKEKKWGIGLSVGAGFSYNLVPRPYIGLGINYNIIKF